MVRPYTDQQDIRTFSQDVHPNELMWHRDQENRLVEVIGTTDWMFQLDNQLPKPLTKIFIKKDQWHRLIKGTGDLTVKITKYE